MNSKHKIFYEKLDPTLLDMINDVTNNDVSTFHRDNFLYFKNFSQELKRDEIYSRIDSIKVTANQRGYNINSMMNDSNVSERMFKTKKSKKRKKKSRKLVQKISLKHKKTTKQKKTKSKKKEKRKMKKRVKM